MEVGEDVLDPRRVMGIDHDTVCAGVVCAAIPGTARVGPAVYLRLREDSITNEQWYFAMVNITRG